MDIPDDEYLFIRKQLSLCKEYVVTGKFDALNDLYDKTKIYQEKYSIGLTQPASQYRADKDAHRQQSDRRIEHNGANIL